MDDHIEKNIIQMGPNFVSLESGKKISCVSPEMDEIEK